MLSFAKPRFTRAAHFVGGGLGALVVGWLGLAALAFGFEQLFDNLEPMSVPRAGVFNSDYLVAGAVISFVIGLVALPIISYTMGFVCAFFWHRLPASANDSYIGHAMLVLLAAQLPLIFTTGFAIVPALIFVSPLLIFPMRRGLEIGLKWWSADEMRHFLGLRNIWERESR